MLVTTGDVIHSASAALAVLLSKKSFMVETEFFQCKNKNKIYNGYKFSSFYFQRLCGHFNRLQAKLDLSV
jgi:hypothetical protein